MTKEDKNILLRLLQQHKELGISEQIDYLVDILDFVAEKDEFTTEQIVEFGYLEAHGGNKNRTYSKHL